MVYHLIMKPSQYKANRKYQKNNTKSYGFMFNKNYDKDIIEKLDSVENKSQYIKDLIRRDLQS